LSTAPSTQFAWPASAGAPVDLMDALRKARRRLTIAGVLALILGAVAVIVPAIASVATAIFVGWILIVASAFHAADAWAVEHGGRRALRLVPALLTLAAGLYLVVAPLAGAFTLTVVLVIWFMATGTARIVVGIAERGVPGWWMTVVNGVLSVGLGVLIAEGLPSSAGWAIGLIVGVDLIFSGTILMALGSRLKQVVP
jgi:uncharacterized membrane protein HdeD (DUF308 family)